MDQPSTVIVLTKENAPNVLSVRNIDYPEWGTFRFNYNDLRLKKGYCSTIGSGSISLILPWQNYDHWEVVSFRSPLPLSPAGTAL
jgi:hypothetical protein